MGEIIFSICVGGFLVLSGIAMNVILHREEKQIRAKGDKGEKHGSIPES